MRYILSLSLLCLSLIACAGKPSITIAPEQIKTSNYIAMVNQKNIVEGYGGQSWLLRFDLKVENLSKEEIVFRLADIILHDKEGITPSVYLDTLASMSALPYREYVVNPKVAGSLKLYIDSDKRRNEYTFGGIRMGDNRIKPAISGLPKIRIILK